MARKQGLRNAKAPKVRIVLAGREALVLEAFRALLETDFDVAGIATDGRSLVEECSSSKPDVIVLDAAMATLSGLDGRELFAACPAAKLLFLTSNSDPRLAAEALRLVAAGYVLKTGEADELKRAIRGAASGRSRLTSSTGTRNPGDYSSGYLTMRQKEVLQLIAEGRSMKEVAEILHVTPRTVAFHKYKMMDRLHVKSTAELVQFAIKTGVIGEASVNSNSKAV